MVPLSTLSLERVPTEFIAKTLIMKDPVPPDRAGGI